MARKTTKERNEDQRLRELKARKVANELRKPSRDDLARMLLWQMITGIQKNQNAAKRPMLDELCNKVVSGLIEQGFDERQSEGVFDALVIKYAKGLNPFRPKKHLKSDVDVYE